jgi:hypothetical protein
LTQHVISGLKCKLSFWKHFKHQFVREQWLHFETMSLFLTLFLNIIICELASLKKNLKSSNFQFYFLLSWLGLTWGVQGVLIHAHTHARAHTEREREIISVLNKTNLGRFQIMLWGYYSTVVIGSIIVYWLLSSHSRIAECKS